MSVLAFDNSNLKDAACGGCDCSGFTPAATFAYNSGAHTVTVTDGSAYDAGDARKMLHARVTAVKGGKAVASSAGAPVVDVSGLDLSEGFQVFATIVSNNGCISDGHFGNNWGTSAASGALGSWDKDSTDISINSANIS